MATHFDAIVIGTGQSGPPLAARLAGAGLRVAVIERGKFGGTCVNNGCIPTKTLVASAYAARLAQRAAEYGVDVGGPVRVDMKRVKARKDEISGQSRAGRRALDARHAERHVSSRAMRASRPAFGGRGRSRAGGRSHLHQRRRPPARSGHARARPGALPHQREHDGGGFSARAPDRGRRQLRRAGVRADVSPLRQPGHDLRDAAAPDRARGRGCLPRGAGYSDQRRRRAAARRQVRRRREGWRRHRRARGVQRRRSPREGLASASGGGQGSQYRRSRSGASRRAHRLAWLHRRRRHAAHQRARRVGAGRLQRAWSVHAYELQRLRDRRGQPAGRGRAQGDRPDRHLRPVHRPAARPHRLDRSASAGRAGTRSWSENGR